MLNLSFAHECEQKSAYLELCVRGQSRRRLSRSHHDHVYYESHHIFPKCLWPNEIDGRDDKTNLTLLTYDEHVEAHRLLVQMTNGLVKSKMLQAYHRLTHSVKGDKIDAASREEAARWQSEHVRGEFSPSYGKPKSEATKEKIRLKKLGQPGPRRGAKNSADHIAKAAAAKSLPFKFVDPNGEIHEGVNLNVFCKELGLNQSHMNRVRKGLATHYKQWRVAT